MKSRGKQATREYVWRLLEVNRVARFPGTRGRIPNFIGAEQAALVLASHPIWKRARVVKVNPDAPQLPVRRIALREGKVVYMAQPRLRNLKSFVELEPSKLGGQYAKAATIAGASRLGTPVALEEVRPIDLIVSGAVAVNPTGARVGKGGGYADLEYALLRESGKITVDTPVVTTVHPLQIVPFEFEMAQHDIVLDWIATPASVARCRHRARKPAGIQWEVLPPDKIEAIPVLSALRRASTAHQ